MNLWWFWHLPSTFHVVFSFQILSKFWFYSSFENTQNFRKALNFMKTIIENTEICSFVENFKPDNALICNEICNENLLLSVSFSFYSTQWSKCFLPDFAKQIRPSNYWENSSNSVSQNVEHIFVLTPKLLFNRKSNKINSNFFIWFLETVREIFTELMTFLSKIRSFFVNRIEEKCCL